MRLELLQWQEMLWLLIMAGKTRFLTTSHFQPLSCWFCHLYWYSQSGILKVSICASVCLTGKVGEGRGVGFIKTMFSCKENNLLILHLNIFYYYYYVTNFSESIMALTLLNFIKLKTFFFPDLTMFSIWPPISCVMNELKVMWAH